MRSPTLMSVAKGTSSPEPTTTSQYPRPERTKVSSHDGSETVAKYSMRVASASRGAAAATTEAARMPAAAPMIRFLKAVSGGAGLTVEEEAVALIVWRVRGLGERMVK